MTTNINESEVAKRLKLPKHELLDLYLTLGIEVFVENKSRVLSQNDFRRLKNYLDTGITVKDDSSNLTVVDDVESDKGIRYKKNFPQPTITYDERSKFFPKAVEREVERILVEVDSTLINHALLEAWFIMGCSKSAEELEKVTGFLPTPEDIEWQCDCFLFRRETTRPRRNSKGQVIQIPLWRCYHLDYVEVQPIETQSTIQMKKIEALKDELTSGGDKKMLA